MKSVLFVLYLMVIIPACTSDESAMPVPSIPIDDTVLISYALDIYPILETYCLGVNGQACHVANSNQGAPGDFTTYGDLKEKVDEGSIESRVFNSNGGMPPSYSLGPTELTDSALQEFMLWVDQGAPEN